MKELQTEERKTPSRFSLLGKRVKMLLVLEEGIEEFREWLGGLFSMRDEWNGDGKHVSLGDILHDFSEQIVVHRIVRRDGSLIDEENHRGVEMDFLELTDVLVVRSIVEKLVLRVHRCGNRIHLEELTAGACANRVERTLLDVQRGVIVENGRVHDEGVELVVPAVGR